MAPRLGGTLVEDLTPRQLVRFRVELEEAGAGAQTISKVFTVLGSVLSEAVRQGQIVVSPTRAVSRPRQRRRRAVRPPTPERVEIIRAGLASEVDRALVTLLAYVGLRPQEALAAVWSDVIGGKLVVDASKTGRTRVVPLLPVVRQELAALQLLKAGPVRARRSSRRAPARPGARAAFGRSVATGGRGSRRTCGRTTCATPTCR